MKPQRSLRRRLLLSLGALLTVLWMAAASVTAILAGHATEELFDSALQETAQRILPLAVAEVLGREDEGRTQRLTEIREHDEFLTYVVRDAQGRILLLSHRAEATAFPGWSGVGFSQSATHRFYHEEALQGSVRLTVAEPMAHRTRMAREIQISLGLPVLIFLPVVLLAIALVVRLSLKPVQRLRERLEQRSARDLSRVPVDELPTELAPVVDTLNDLLGRLAAAFEAERSFAANAAHELRTPLAGAIAQAQRLQAETGDPGAKARAADIEATLKRLTRFAERLMQLARAEGERLRLDHAADLRPVARILTDELARMMHAPPIALDLPDEPVMSDLEPDVFAILYRNLVDNATRHGMDGAPIHVALSRAGVLTVANDGPIVTQEALARLTDRFERAGTQSDGTGLGLAIVHAIAQRIDSSLVLSSPRPGQSSGFEAALALPVAQGGHHGA